MTPGEVSVQYVYLDILPFDEHVLTPERALAWLSQEHEIYDTLVHRLAFTRAERRPGDLEAASFLHAELQVMVHACAEVLETNEPMMKERSERGESKCSREEWETYNVALKHCADRVEDLLDTDMPDWRRLRDDLKRLYAERTGAAKPKRLARKPKTIPRGDAVVIPLHTRGRGEAV